MIWENKNYYKKHIKCTPEFKDGYCRYCGSKLQKWIDSVPYGDTTVPMETWYCPKGC